MGLADQFAKEDRIEVKFTDFYNLVKGCTERDVILKGVKCNVPHKYMREMITGEMEDQEKKDIPENCNLLYRHLEGKGKNETSKI